MNHKKTSATRLTAFLTLALFAGLGMASTATATADTDVAGTSGNCKGDTFDGSVTYRCTGLWSAGSPANGFCLGEYEEDKREDKPYQGECHGIEYHPLARAISS